MGLNGRKLKQRIGNDPRNLSWADDAARFGTNYLAKFGWDSSKGLGASGEGRKSHLQVSKKLDMLGIGAAHQLDPNGIAWKQNKDFENLLKRLNGDAVEGSVVEGFRKADSGEMDGVGEEKMDEEKKDGKRKRDDRSKEATKKKKFENKDEDEGKEDPRATSIPSERERSTSGPPVRRTVPTLPRHRAHRARAIAAKNLSSKSAAQISEILGIAPTPTTATSSGLTSGTDTPQDGEPASDTLEMERITTSTISVHDYFKEKLKTGRKLSTHVHPSVGMLGHTDRDLLHDAPRGGLGSSSRMAVGSSESTLSSTFLAATRQPLPNDASSHTKAAAETQVAKSAAATPVGDNEVKKKKKKKAEIPVSEDGARRSKKRKDVGECHSKTSLDRDDSKRGIGAGEDSSASFTTKKKKRKK